MNEIIKKHIEHGFFVKIEKIKEFPCIKATFPDVSIYKNTIDSCWKIYEMDKDGLTIYKNGKKNIKIQVPLYSQRTIIICDLISTCRKYKINDKLIINFENNLPVDKKLDMNEILPKHFNINKDKESKVVELLKILSSKKNTKNFVEKNNLEYEEEIMKDIIERGGL